MTRAADIITDAAMLYAGGTPVDFEAVANQVLAELDALRATELVNLITATHKARGRHNTQIAMCNLYAAVGLTSVRPIMTQQ